MKSETTEIPNDHTFDLTEDECAIIADALSDWLDGRNDQNAHRVMTKIGCDLYRRFSNV